MYRYLIDLRSYTDNIPGMLALFAGVLAAVAFFILLVNPVHNYVKYSVAAKRGDTSFEEYGLRTLSPRANFHLVGFISTLLLNVNFTQPVYVEDDNMRNPRLSRVLMALSGFGVYVFTFLVSGLAYSLMREFSFFNITYASILPYKASYFAYAYYALYVAVLFVFRISICSIFMNLIPLGSLDMADACYPFLPINWADGLRNNETIISLLLFVVIFLTLGAPDGLFNVVGNSVMLNFSKLIRALF